jgi:hypothetical protein
MPRTTTAISERDLDVLDFVARFGLVPARAVRAWAGTAATVSYERERRWLLHGLVETLEPINGSGRLLVCTRDGLRAVGRDRLGPGLISVGRRPHAIAVVEIAATLEREGRPVLSERELAALEAECRRRIYSAELNDRRLHRPDLVLPDSGIAVEVELSQKASWRLDSILRAWRNAIGAGRFDKVRYLCGGRALKPVKQAVKRTVTDELIEVVALPPAGCNRNGRD